MLSWAWWLQCVLLELKCCEACVSLLSLAHARSGIDSNTVEWNWTSLSLKGLGLKAQGFWAAKLLQALLNQKLFKWKSYGNDWTVYVSQSPDLQKFRKLFALCVGVNSNCEVCLVFMIHKSSGWCNCYLLGLLRKNIQKQNSWSDICEWKYWGVFIVSFP